MGRQVKDYDLDLMNPWHCYFLGVVLGDGTVSKGKVRVCVGLDDIDYAKRLVEIISLCGWQGQITKGRNDRTVDVSIYSSKLADKFRKFKLKCKDDSVSSCAPWDFPEPVFHANYFCAGLIDTDGHVGVYEIRIGQKSSESMMKVKPIFEALGITFSLNLNTSYPRICYTGSTNLRKLVKILPLQAARKRAASLNHLLLKKPGQKSVYSDSYVCPLNVIKAYAECGENLRLASRSTGFSRATIKRKLKEVESAPLFRQGGHNHLVVEEEPHLYKVVEQMVAICKRDAAKINEFLTSAISKEIREWE